MVEQVANEYDISEDEVVLDESGDQIQARPIPERELEIIRDEIGTDYLMSDLEATNIIWDFTRPSEMDEFRPIITSGGGTSEHPTEELMNINPDEYARYYEDDMTIPEPDEIRQAQEIFKDEYQRAEENPEAYVEELRQNDSHIIDRTVQAEEQFQRNVSETNQEYQAKRDIAENLGVSVDDLETDTQYGQLEVTGISDSGREQIQQRVAQDQFNDLIDPGAVDVSVDSGSIQTDVDPNVARDAAIDRQRQQIADEQGVDRSDVQLEGDYEDYDYSELDEEELEFFLSEEAREEKFLEDLESELDDPTQQDENPLSRITGRVRSAIPFVEGPPEDPLSGVEYEDVAGVDLSDGQAQIQFTEEYQKEQTRANIAEQYSQEQPGTVDPEDIQNVDISGEEVDYQLSEAAETEFQRESARDQFAEELSIDESQFDVVEQDGQFVPDLDRDAEEDLLIDQVVEEEGVERSEVNVVETDSGELGVRIDEERERRLGRALESASDWWQSGAETISGTVEEYLPSEPVYLSTTSGRSIETDADIDETVGAFVETGTSTVDPAGAALTTGDTLVAARDELKAAAEFQEESADELATMGFEDFQSEPLDYTSTVLDTGFGAGYWSGRAQDAGAATVETGQAAGEAFAEEPVVSSARVAGGGLVAYAAPAAVSRGVSQIRRLDFEPRGDMISRGPDRGQMDLTIQRQRPTSDLPDSERPADPEATTPEGRTAPREAFESDEAYQQALRRREEQMVQELVDSEPAGPGPDATPVERVRASQDMFSSQAEYQRELQRAREQMQQTQRQDSSTGVFGDPTATETFGSPNQMETATAVDDVGADSGSQDRQTVFASPNDSGTVLEAGSTAATRSQDLSQVFGDLSSDVTTEQMLGMDQQYGDSMIAGVSSATAADTAVYEPTMTAMSQPTATASVLEQPTAMDMSMGQPSQMMQQTITRSGRPTRPRVPFPEWDPEDPGDGFFDFETEDAAWETGIAEAEDLGFDFDSAYDYDFWGSDSDNSEWWS
ncbi:hypothetical protein [Halostagnicola sp. A56]|uniref:hypothetical protein n=1 Tax=Halostagnicola sp. A56 TaxID=1495067 RepID=UPI0012E28585|nr:hypothetical protein [Halostagnicola sp. A56]